MFSSVAVDMTGAVRRVCLPKYLVDIVVLEWACGNSVLRCVIGISGDRMNAYLEGKSVERERQGGKREVRSGLSGESRSGDTPQLRLSTFPKRAQ